MASRARVDRGRATERMLAERWQGLGLFPWAQPVGPGRSGRDMLNTPGVFVEIKARGTVTLPSQLKKAVDDAAKSRRQSDVPHQPPDMPIIIWRHNGQGPVGMDNWTVTLSLIDYEEMLRAWQKVREDC